MTFQYVSDIVERSNKYKKNNPDNYEIIIYCGINAYRELKSKCVKSLFGSTESGDETFNGCRLIFDTKDFDRLEIGGLKNDSK